MRCPSCGAVLRKRTMKCPDCGAFRNKNWVEPEQPQSQSTVVTENITDTKAIQSNGSSSLIAFPGTARSSVPEWRRELGERVREVQERRAREAALENETSPAEAATPQLELLPTVESPVLNPLVAAALQRIERAHARPQYAGNAAVATLQDYEPESLVNLNVSAAETEPDDLVFEEEIKVNDTPPVPERVHNLAVVPALPLDEIVVPPKPKRLIRDDNDPALNYLDSLPTTVGVDVTRHQSAPILRRLMGGIVDLVVIAILASPLAALIQVNQLNWEEPRTIAFAAASFVLVGFLYLTISTAFTGRTLGMRLIALRVVDARTGLIPTGGQSAKRAFCYIVSLTAAAIPLMYTLIDRDRQAPHDRFSRTAVVRV
jgi:uncharacterized RDD family membrane protein YckC